MAGCRGTLAGVAAAALVATLVGSARCVAEPAQERGDRAYLSNLGRDSIVALDTESFEIVSTIAVGPGVRPGRIATSPDGVHAAAVSESAGTVSLIDLETAAVESVAVDCPYECRLADLVFSPDGALLYVLDSGFDRHRILVVDVGERRQVGETELDRTGHTGGIDELAISPDGAVLYALKVDGIFVVDTGAGTVANWLQGFFTDIVVSPGGETLYASTPSAVVALDDGATDLREVSGESGEYLAVSPDGSTLFIVKGLPGLGRELVFFDLEAGRPAKTLTLAPPRTATLQDMVLAPDGSAVLVLDRTAESLLVVPTAPGDIRRVELPHRPLNVAVGADSRTAYVANYGSHSGNPAVTTVDLETFEIGEMFRPASPAAMAGTPDGNTLLVANWLANEVVFVDPVEGRVADRIEVARPVDIVVDASGTLAYVAASRAGEGGPPGRVAVVDIPRRRVVAMLELETLPGTIALDDVNRRLYVSSHSGRSGGLVSVVDAERLAIVDSVSTQYPIAEMTLTRTGKILAGGLGYGLNDIFGGLLAIDPVHGLAQVLARTGGVQSIALSPDGEAVYATVMFYLGGSQLQAIAAGDGSLLQSVQLDDSGPVAVLPGGDHAIVAEQLRGAVSMIELRTLSTVERQPIGGQFSDVTVLPAPGPNSFELSGCMPEFFGRNCGSAAGLAVQAAPLDRTAVTDGDGIFRFDDLPAGHYELTVRPRCTSFGICYRATGVIVPGQTTVVIESMARCPGDCDGFATVSVDEIIACISIALGQSDLSACISCDRDEDDNISVAELIQSVVSSLEGCSDDRL